MTLKALFLGTVLAFASGASYAGDATLGDLRIEGAWARASAGPARNGAAYLTVVNAGGQPDQLVAAASEASAKAELHTHEHENGVMRMRQVPAIDIPAGQSVSLQPGGAHVMLFELGQPLTQGTSFPVTLTFAKAGSVTVMVDVKPAGALSGANQATPGAGHMPHGPSRQ